MGRRARAIIDAGIAVATTIVIVFALTFFTSVLSTPPMVGGRAWWVLAWAVAVMATAVLLAGSTTAVRHLACLGVSATMTLAHLMGYQLGFVPVDASAPALILTDFVFLGTAIVALTLVNIRRHPAPAAPAPGDP